MTSARAETLLHLVRKHNWRTGVELGVYEGATTDHLLSNAPLLQMVGVDVWQPIEGGPKNKNTGFSPKAADVIGAAKAKAYNVQQVHGHTRFLIVERRTVDAAALWGPGWFDFVFVDASHVTADVVADCRAWLPKVKHGGMMLGHDANWPAIQAALAELTPDFDARAPTGFREIMYFGGNVWGVRV